MISKILLSGLVSILILVGWLGVWEFANRNKPVFPWDDSRSPQPGLVVVSLVVVFVLRLFFPGFWFWTTIVTLTLLLMWCLFKSIIWSICACAFVCLATGWFFLRPVFKPGPQWIETDGGVRVWADCPSEATNVVWSGESKACVATGPGDFKVCFMDDSVLKTNAVLRWGFSDTVEPNALEEKGFRFFGAVKNGKPRGFGVLCSPKGYVVGTFRSNGSAKGDVLGFDSADRLVYEGGYRRFEYHGKGRLVLKDGTRYEGGFRKGRYDGKGLLVLKDGTRYAGGFVHGRRDGYGREWFPDGSRFKGYFKADERNGRGASTDATGTRSWHVWKNGRIADKDQSIRSRLEAENDRFSPKMRERFERYLCFYELNCWWMTAFVILFLSGFLYGSYWIWKTVRPRMLVVDKKMDPSYARWSFLWGSCIGLHRMRTGNRWWFLFPALLVLAAVFSMKSLVLFLPFPVIWLAMPTRLVVTNIALLFFVCLCLYDILFGTYYDVYRFNWRLFRTSSVDECLENGTGPLFKLPGQSKEMVQRVEEETQGIFKSLESVWDRLKTKHLSDKERERSLSFFGIPILPRTRARFREHRTGDEEVLTREMIQVYLLLRKSHQDLREQAKLLIQTLNKAHYLARRARNLLLELQDEITKEPMKRSRYERQVDRVELNHPDAFPLLGNYLPKGFRDLWDDILSDWHGEKDQLSKFREDQAECRRACSTEEKEILRLCSLVREFSDRISLHGGYLHEFHKQYVAVREVLFPRCSVMDCFQRMFGYRSRRLVLGNEERMNWLDDKIGKDGELTKLILNYKQFDRFNSKTDK